MAEQNGAALGGKLKSLEITLTNYKRDKSLDLRPFISDLTIFENIFSPTLHGVATVIDAIGFLSGYAFNILGEEFLTISYELPDSDLPRKTLDFFLYKVDNVFNAENFKHKRYVIHFCSVEHINDACTIIQKAYDKQNSEIVQSILTEFLKTKKKIEVQATRGAQKLIIPSLRPFDAIDFLRRRSVAEQKYESASYQFFETTEGFNFCDIEYLIVKGRDKYLNDSKPYTYYLSQGELQRTSSDNSSGNSNDPRNYNVAEFKNLFGFRQVHKIDTIEKMKMGQYKSVAQIFDPVRVKFVEEKHVYNPDKFKRLGHYSENSNDFETDVSLNKPGPGRQIFIGKDSEVANTFLDIVEINSTQYMTALAQNQFAAHAIGDPRIVAGDVISIPNFWAFRTPDDHGLDDKMLSGRFLITGIVHKFGQETYTVDLELYRNGYATDPETVVDLNTQ